MDQGQVALVMQDAISTVLTVALPMLLAGMVVGIVVSIFQATTQIHEQTLAFVPKIIVIFLAILLLGSWMLTNLEEFTLRVYSYVNQIQ